MQMIFSAAVAPLFSLSSFAGAVVDPLRCVVEFVRTVAVQRRAGYFVLGKQFGGFCSWQPVRLIFFAAFIRGFDFVAAFALCFDKELMV